MSLQGNNLPIYANNPTVNVGTLTNANGAGTLGVDSGGVAIYTAGTNGSRVYSALLSYTTTVSLSFFLYIVNSGNVYPIGHVTIPSAGVGNGSAAFDALSVAHCVGLPLDMTGKPYVELAPGSVLKISCASTIDLTQTLYTNTIGSDY